MNNTVKTYLTGDLHRANQFVQKAKTSPQTEIIGGIFSISRSQMNGPAYAVTVVANQNEHDRLFSTLKGADQNRTTNAK